MGRESSRPIFLSRHNNYTPDMKLIRSSQRGFTLVEIMIVVSIIGLLAVIAIPSFFKNREVAQKNTCVSNLRVIDTAKQLWAMETGRGDDDEPFDEDIIGLGLYLKREPLCPSGGEYTFMVIADWPTCDFNGGSDHVFVEED